MELRRPTFVAINVTALLLLAAGCQSGAPAARTERMQEIEADRAVASDPVAIQMQNISGAMLMYIAGHQKLPAHLEDLRKSPDVDTPLVFISPTTGKPYSYEPAGLVSEGKSKRIVLYESDAGRKQSRWCILMSDPAANAPLSVDVLLVPESVFKTYHPASALTGR
jgi:hypothetical protein